MKESFCLSLNQTLLNALTSLVISFSKKNIAVVTNEDDCSRQFYSTLESEVSTHKGRKFRRMNLRHILHYKTSSQYHKDIKNTSFYELKSYRFKVAVLLVDNFHIPLVLRDLITLGLLQSSAKWLIPAYNQEFSPFNWFPEKILSFEIKQKGFYKIPYRRLQEDVLDLIKLNQASRNQHLSRYKFKHYVLPHIEIRLGA